MVDRPPRHHLSKPTPAKPRREFTMEPIEPAEWALTINLLRLSPLQANIVAMLVQEANEGEIGTELGLTRETVRVYLADILQHVGVHTHAELVSLVRWA